MAMDKKVKARWIKALLSGKFRQAQNRLRAQYSNGRAKGYCCLGVLAKVEGAKWLDGRPIIDGNDVKSYMQEYLTDTFAKPLGLTRKQQETLGNMNDDGKSFKEIAAYIRKNL